jgi:putative flippase GtrA
MSNRLDWTAPTFLACGALCAASGAVCLIGAVGFGAAFGFSAPGGPLLKTVAIGAALAGISVLYSTKRPDARIAALAAGAAFLVLFTLAGMIFSYTSTATAQPLQDARFAAADAALGFDWPAHLRFVVERPWLWWTLNIVYKLATPCTAVVVLALGGFGGAERLAKFCAAYALTATAVVAISALAPGFGGYAQFAIDPELLARMPLRDAGQEHYAHLAALRAGTLRTIPLDDAQGLVTFPSFHTVLAALCGWALWPVRRIGAAFAALNALIVAATPTMGGHYLVDVLAGGALAALALGATTMAARLAARLAAREREAAEPATGGREVSVFAVAGGLAFLVDAGVTAGLTALGAGPVLARAPAISASVVTTFAINRRYAFAASGRGLAEEFARYVAVSAAGAAVNVLAYLAASAVLTRFGLTPTLAAPLAVAVGSGAGMFANYFGYRGFAFAPARTGAGASS